MPDSTAIAAGIRSFLADVGGAGAAPCRVHADADRDQQRQHGNEERRFEVRRANGDLAGIERIEYQRIDRAEEDQPGRDAQQDVVDQQESSPAKTA